MRIDHAPCGLTKASAAYRAVKGIPEAGYNNAVCTLYAIEDKAAGVSVLSVSDGR